MPITKNDLLKLGKVSIIESLEMIKDGQGDYFTGNTKTRLCKKMERLRDLSSNKFKDLSFDTINGEGLDIPRIKELIDEWNLNLCSSAGIYNTSNIIRSKHGERLKCEFCGSNSKCNYVYIVTNSKTGNTLNFGSQCIKQLNIPVKINGEKILNSDIDKQLKKVEEKVESFINTHCDDILETCYKDIYTICYHKCKMRENLTIPSDHVVPRIEFNSKPCKFTDVYNQYRAAEFSVMEKVKSGELSKDDCDSKISSEEIISISSSYMYKLYNWSYALGVNNPMDVTFIPGMDLCINNLFAYHGVYKYLIMRMLAKYYMGKKLDIEKELNELLKLDLIYNKKYIKAILVFYKSSIEYYTPEQKSFYKKSNFKFIETDSEEILNQQIKIGNDIKDIFTIALIAVFELLYRQGNSKNYVDALDILTGIRGKSFSYIFASNNLLEFMEREHDDPDISFYCERLINPMKEKLIESKNQLEKLKANAFTSPSNYRNK